MIPRFERFAFAGHDGAPLAARLEFPDGPARATAVFAHCFTCSKDIAAARRIARRLTAHGVAVLRFDFTGLGHSGGEFANTGFRSNVEDLVRAAQALGARLAPPQLLVGHSFGGAAAIAAAGALPSVRAVATIGAPADPAHVLGHLGAALAAIRRDGEAEATIAGRAFRIGRRFVEDVETARLLDCAAALDRPLLVLHAPDDEVVDVSHAERLFAAARQPKSLVALDGADHLLTRAADAEWAADLIATWAARRLDPPAPAAADAPPEGVVRVAEADPAGYLQDIRVGPHHLLADEPADQGGGALGPSPYQLVAAGLGACTAMTIRMYARRKGLPLDHVAVDVSHAKIHAADCADCETKEGKVDLFRRAIRLEGDLSDAERARLIEIANRCPVHRTLEGEIEVETTAV